MKEAIIFFIMLCLAAVSGQDSKSDVEKMSERGSVVAETPSDGLSENVMEETEDLSDKTLGEIYLDSVRKLYKDKIGLWGDPIYCDYSGYVDNYFAIVDVDYDGSDELVLRWNDTAVAGMWGGVFQYDYEKKEYRDEGLTEPDITFYSNGVAYEPWRHNQGYGEMWPYDASRYNSELDVYEHVLTVDSWNKDIREEEFPEEADTDHAGVVYFTDMNDLGYVDYDNPVSQSEYKKIANKLFKGAKEISIDYYVISDEGIQDYLSTR